VHTQSHFFDNEKPDGLLTWTVAAELRNQQPFSSGEIGSLDAWWSYQYRVPAFSLNPVVSGIMPFERRYSASGWKICQAVL
jgi:hypothetical protein